MAYWHPICGGCGYCFSMQGVKGLLHEVEPPASQILSRLLKVIVRDFDLIQFLHQGHQYYDEPKLWSYSARLNDKFSPHDGGALAAAASGCSFFSKKEALLKCLMESIERYCNFVFNHNAVSFVGSPRQLAKKKINFALPPLLTTFSQKQPPRQTSRDLDDNSRLRWATCESLSDGSPLLVPCQSIWLSYPYLPKEPVMYPSISTGVAAGSCLSATLVRGILEIIERDAFIIYYLQKLPAPKINLELMKTNQVVRILEIVKRYKLEVHCFDITTDIGIPVMLSIVLDRTGIGKAVSVGLKSDLNPVGAVVGSITEAFHTRKWIRMEYEKNQRVVRPEDLLEDSNLVTRGLLWYPIRSIKCLDFWLKNCRTRIVKEEGVPLSSGEQLKRTLHALAKHGHTVYWRSLMIPDLRRLNIHVVKTIIPQFQSLYLNEKYRLAVSDRVYEIPRKLGFRPKRESELNTFPHPFL